MTDTPQAKLSPIPKTEKRLLYILAGIQLTHIVDFMVMMPIGPLLTRELGVTAEQDVQHRPVRDGEPDPVREDEHLLRPADVRRIREAPLQLGSCERAPHFAQAGARRVDVHLGLRPLAPCARVHERPGERARGAEEIRAALEGLLALGGTMESRNVYCMQVEGIALLQAEWRLVTDRKSVV